VSSVFLYVAIVAIWAFVLVPRWLRRHHAQPRSLADSDPVADAPPEPFADADDEYAAEPADYPADEAEPFVPAAPASQPAPARTQYAQPAQSLPRSRMMQARRRLLTILVLISAAAGAATAIRLIPWWTCVAPVLVLACYFLLLRTAARADAEHARRLASVQAREARIEAEARRRAAVAAAPVAQIIDISRRVADQLYDQYADATVRAVGD
jgi:hypothetical protein